MPSGIEGRVAAQAEPVVQRRMTTSGLVDRTDRLAAGASASAEDPSLGNRHSARPAVAQHCAQGGRSRRRSWLLWYQRLASFLTSLIFHAGVLIALSLWVLPRPERRLLNVEAGYVEPLALREEKPAELSATDFLEQAAPTESERIEFSPGLPPVLAVNQGASVPVSPLPAAASRDWLERMMEPSHVATGGGYEGRNPQWRARLVASRGGTPESESAVELGLAWLAAHQWADGGWRFDHTGGPCRGMCRDPGRVATTTGATGLALLAFLGAGYTHHSGTYRDVVQRGLYYLGQRMLVTPYGGDLQEGTMYAQGIATLALCEAYAMTQDATLRPMAQQGVDFICYAQHPQGGWRYVPGQPGDTTVFGWQIMALKSARMAGLEVPSPVIDAAMRYLDSVQSQGGAAYGYQKSGNEPACTAIGLLSRMYYGWRRNDPRLEKGVGILQAIGPSRNDVYFNYYATQVMHHYHGQGWEKWNTTLRDYLVSTQQQQGHERGSWYFPDRHGAFGGRHYTTCMCVMILEVYYRHMPLYDAPAADEGF